MKGKVYLWLLTTAIVLLSSCVSDENLYDPAKAVELKKAEYQEAFEKKFGKIAADQNWGFSTSAVSRAHISNENNWGKLVYTPTEISQAEKNKVVEWFSTHQYPTTLTVNWSDFFVQHVSRPNERMNQVLVGKPDGTYEKSLTYNNENRTLIFMQNSGTSSFGYHSNEDGDDHYNYSIQYIDGAYYVGFDFEATGNKNHQEAADGYYNDWIVKIIPGNFKNAKRIMAEDLGNIGDFDFNDVVFDAAIDGDYAVITLLAAGGTLPLYIGSPTEENEVHNRFGVSTTTIVNTEADKHKEFPPVIFRLKGIKDISEIPVSVNNNGSVFTLSADTGIAPGKICIPNTLTDWSNERVSIEHEDSYPRFKEYVSNPEVEWWIKDE